MMKLPDAFVKAIVKEIKTAQPTKMQLNSIKTRLTKVFKLGTLPTDIDIFLQTPEKDVNALRKYLLTKPTRSISGVTPIAVMSKPLYCPHGKCTFCPGGPGSVFGDVPQSYTGKEPSTMRAIRANYDPYLIVMNRLEQFCVTGHVPEKVDIIIQGGTFCAFPKEYQEEEIYFIFKAMNDFSKLFYYQQKTKGKDHAIFDFMKFKKFFELPGDIGNPQRQERIHKKLLAYKGKFKQGTIEQEHCRNEKSAIRCIGLTVETKPDWAFKEHGNVLLDLGVTRIELGVQSVYDEPLRVTHRGHTLQDSIRSIKELKDIGFKLNFHYMLGLPKVSCTDDRRGLSILFKNPEFKPDMLKIYPCMVMQGTPLYNIWKAGMFTPITTQEAAVIIAEFKREIPTYCRVMRVQRDIPTYRTEAGVDRTNLRQYVDEICKERNIHCRCIRCREVGHQQLKNLRKLNKPSLVVVEYASSHGKDFFISYEDRKNDLLYGFVRLRFPSAVLRKEITEKTGLIRELHVYGEATSLGEQGKVQHRGLGKKLMLAAEKICKKHGKNKVVVISGVGVRDYYRKLGYQREGVYMVKKLYLSLPPLRASS